MELYSITTTASADTGGYGNMFDVQTLVDVSIIGMDFFTERDYHVKFELWTKPGTYVGSETNSKAWQLVATGNVKGKGYNDFTKVPLGMWLHSVKILANSTQAFYFTLSGDDLLYSVGTEIDDAYTYNSHIIIKEGIGIAGFPFSQYFFGPRVWNGALHYVVDPTTPLLPSKSEISDSITTTQVTYYFSIDSSSIKGPEMIKIVDQRLYDSVKKLLKDGDELLKIMVERSQLQVLPTNCSYKNHCASSSIRNEQHTLCEFMCTITLVFDQSIVSEAQVQNSLYLHAKDVIDYLPGSIQTFTKSTSARIILIHDGLMEMNYEAQYMFEHICTEFFNHFLMQLTPPITIRSTSINRQQNESKHFAQSLQLNSSQYALTVDTTILGEFHGPISCDFGMVVRDALNIHSEDFIEYLQRYRYFDYVDDVIAGDIKNIFQPTSLLPDEQPQNQYHYSELTLIIGIMVFFLAGVVNIITECTRERRNNVCNKHEKEILYTGT